MYLSSRRFLLQLVPAHKLEIILVSKLQDVVAIDGATVPCQIVGIEKVYHPQRRGCITAPGDTREGVLVGQPAMFLLVLAGAAPYFLGKGHEFGAGGFGVLRVVGH